MRVDPNNLTPDQWRRSYQLARQIERIRDHHRADSLATHRGDAVVSGEILEAPETAPCVCYHGHERSALRGSCECKRTGWKVNADGTGVQAISIPCDPEDQETTTMATRTDAIDADDPVMLARAKRDALYRDGWRLTDANRSGGAK